MGNLGKGTLIDYLIFSGLFMNICILVLVYVFSRLYLGRYMYINIYIGI